MAKIEIQSESGNTYTVDTEEVTCTCPHFKFRCRHFSRTDDKRLCKHLSAVYEKTPELMPIDLQHADEGFPKASGTVMEDGKTRYPRSMFDNYVGIIRQAMSLFPEVIRFEICGSYRRRAAMVSDLDVLFVLKDGASVDGLFNYCENFLGYERICRGDIKAAYMSDGLVHIDFKVVPMESWPFATMHFTGSKSENIQMRRRANQLGMKLNEYGLFTDDQPIDKHLDSEQSIYEFLGMPYKEPWER